MYIYQQSKPESLWLKKQTVNVVNQPIRQFLSKQFILVLNKFILHSRTFLLLWKVLVQNFFFELCCNHGISQPSFYKWTKDFVEACKKLYQEDLLNTLLKEYLADYVIRYDIEKDLNMFDNRS